MCLAEEAFGQRDARFKIHEFRLAEPPSCICFVDDYTVYIKLGTECLKDFELACYQMAHETVHLLSPVKSGSETVLEEGVATEFGCDFMVHHYQTLGWPKPERNWSSTGDPIYNGAKVLASKLLRINPGAIRILRKIQPAISRLDPDIIRSQFPDIALSAATELCEPFPLWAQRVKYW